MEIERSKDPFKDLINSIEGIDSLPKKEPPKLLPEPILIIPKASPIPQPKDDIELYVQNIVLHAGQTYDQGFVEVVADMLREAEVVKQQKCDKLLFSYIVLILWDKYNSAKSKMDAMKEAWLLGIAYNESLYWDEGEDDD